MRELQQTECLREALPGLLVALMCFSCVLLLIVFEFTQSNVKIQVAPARQLSTNTAPSDVEYRKQRLIQAWRRLMLRSRQQSKSLRLSKKTAPTSLIPVDLSKERDPRHSVACGVSIIEEQIAQSFYDYKDLQSINS